MMLSVVHNGNQQAQTQALRLPILLYCCTVFRCLVDQLVHTHNRPCVPGHTRGLQFKMWGWLAGPPPSICVPPPPHHSVCPAPARTRAKPRVTVLLAARSALITSSPHRPLTLGGGS